MVFLEKAKYSNVGRDARDVIWSLNNHHTNANDMWYDALNNTPGRNGPEIGTPHESAVEYFIHWLDNDGLPFWPYWESVRSWWELRNHSNVKENAAESVPLGGAFWEDGANTFIHKGTNERRREDLSTDLSKRYLARAEQELGRDCA